MIYMSQIFKNKNWNKKDILVPVINIVSGYNIYNTHQDGQGIK
jgi:hypothetical protein